MNNHNPKRRNKRTILEGIAILLFVALWSVGLIWEVEWCGIIALFMLLIGGAVAFGACFVSFANTPIEQRHYGSLKVIGLIALFPLSLLYIGYKHMKTQEAMLDELRKKGYH